MSWDVLFVRLPPGTSSLGDLGTNFSPHPLATRRELVASIRQLVPEADFTDPAWGSFVGEDFTIAFDLATDPVESMTLHVRGGPAAFGFVRELSAWLALPAIDGTTGDVIDFAAPDADRGFKAWRAYRDRIVGQSHE